MQKTRNDLSSDVREAVIKLLQARLADAVDLATQAKQAHWNVKGPSFFALHELFDDVAHAVHEHIDAIAERITAPGGIAGGSSRIAAAQSILSVYPLEIADGPAHVAAMADALSAFGEAVRRNIGEAGAAGDEHTADLFTEVSRSIDKQLWFVEAHAQAER